MMQIQFTANVVPTGTVRMTRGRVNLIRSGRYDPNDNHTKAVLNYLNYKQLLGWEAKRHAPREPVKGAIEVSMRFYLPIPESWSEKKRRRHMGDNVPHTVKPDIDNLEKGVYDSMNKIIWRDDAQIFRVKQKEKFYSDRPRVEIDIREIG